MATISSIKAKQIRAIGDKVLVHNMHFGEQKTASGLIISGDDGKERGIYPRWGQVFSKGPDNKDEYEVGHWILIEHGRWTRGMTLELEGKEPTDIRMVENKAILAYAEDKPSDVVIGSTTEHGSSLDIKPEDFMRS
jgi:co-chaperonin GroES (HSP10)